MPLFRRESKERTLSLDAYLELALSRVLRPLFQAAVSRQRLSQSFFVRLSREYRSAGVYHFCPDNASVSLVEFQQAVRSGSAVLVGSSDMDFFPENLKDLRSDVDFYIQNLCAPATKNVHLLPIGIEDLSWARAGMPWNYLPWFARRRKTKCLLVGPFGDTHPERKHLDALRASSKATVLKKRVSSFRYALFASNFLFVACPRGNGRDTHRVWESLYRGAVPVMLEDDFSRCLSDLGVPVVLVQSWDDAAEVCQESRNEFGFDPQALEILRPNYWEDLLSSRP